MTITKLRVGKAENLSAVTRHGFGCFDKLSPKPGRVLQRPTCGESWTPFPFYGDQSSADKSAHSHVGDGSSVAPDSLILDHQLHENSKEPKNFSPSGKD